MWWLLSFIDRETYKNTAYQPDRNFKPCIYSLLYFFLPKAGRVWTAPSSVPVVRGVWAVTVHACVETEPRVTLWMASVLVLLDGGESSVTSPVL